MEVRVIDFRETMIAVLEHHGEPDLECRSIQKALSSLPKKTQAGVNATS